MKKLSLLLFASTLLINTSSQAITPINGGLTFFGHTYWSEVSMHVGCWNAGQCPYDPYHSLPACAPFCDTPDMPYAWSIWIDYATAIATALDAAATWSQNERTINAQDAVDQLEEYLKGGCSGSSSQDETSLATESMDVYAPQIVVDALDDAEDLDSVRSAVEKYVFETTSSEINGDCKDSHNKCAENRQNTWALLSVALAEAMSDKMIKNSEDMSGHFQKLVSEFNGQKNPTGMWGAMNMMTLDNHIQMNDLNALYARDLEMSALGGLNNSGTRDLKRYGI